MSELKTKPNSVSVESYIASIPNDKRRSDANELLRIMTELTHKEPVMWGPSIVGFGSYYYKYASGREGDWMRIGFSGRSSALVIYGLIYNENDPSSDNNETLLEKIGPYKRGKGCLYISSLSLVDLKVLKQMIENSFNNNQVV